MLSESFFCRMRELLGDEYDAFLKAQDEPPQRAVRVNRIKCDPDAFLRTTTLKLTPIPYAQDGYFLDTDIQIGNTPEHHAGVIYSQDGGAMATVNALSLRRGMRVADLCSAPGGKAGQLAAAIGEEGFLLANEYVPKRAKILVGNLERLGVGSAIVTSLDTSELASLYPEFFDLVLADAPCSGEGMLRKYDEAGENWSEENIALCAKRQSEILENAARMVAPDGYLLYSTCTYSEEENEERVTELLARHPELSLCEVSEPLIAATRPGIYREGRPSDIVKTRRFYPHVSRGEGQYMALMKRSSEGKAPESPCYRDASAPLPKDMRAAVERFFSESLILVPRGTLALVGENPVLIPHSIPIPKRSVFMSGVLLGEIRGGVLRPSHQFLSVYAPLFKTRVELTREDTKKYLLGEEIHGVEGGGWCAVYYGPCPIGLGKISGGVMKNHYPKGLRTANTVFE